MKNLVLVAIILGSIFQVSCKKKKDDTIISQFNYNGIDYVTDYALFEIQSLGNVDPYTMSFYSSGITYNFSDSSFVGSGELLLLNLSSSIFINSENKDYSIDNLNGNESFTVNSGYLFIDNDSGEETFEIEEGSISIKNVNNKYYFEYHLDLKTGLTISGIYSGGLLIVDHNFLKSSFINL
jgi:hypothetical protein